MQAGATVSSPAVGKKKPTTRSQTLTSPRLVGKKVLHVPSCYKLLPFSPTRHTSALDLLSSNTCYPFILIPITPVNKPRAHDVIIMAGKTFNVGVVGYG